MAKLYKWFTILKILFVLFIVEKPKINLFHWLFRSKWNRNISLLIKLALLSKPKDNLIACNKWSIRRFVGFVVFFPRSSCFFSDKNNCVFFVIFFSLKLKSHDVHAINVNFWISNVGEMCRHIISHLKIYRFDSTSWVCMFWFAMRLVICTYLILFNMHQNKTCLWIVVWWWCFIFCEDIEMRMQKSLHKS